MIDKPIQKITLTFRPSILADGDSSTNDLFQVDGKALLSYAIHFNARARSITQFAVGSMIFFVCLLTISVSIFVNVAEVGIRDALLYSFYSVTSTGYGTVPMPLDNDLFCLYLVFFMFIGVGSTVVVVSSNLRPVHPLLSLESFSNLVLTGRARLSIRFDATIECPNKIEPISRCCICWSPNAVAPRCPGTI